MATNIVQPQFYDQMVHGAPPGVSQIIQVTIKQRATLRCSKSGGAVYHLSRDMGGRAPNEVLTIWWLAYAQNNHREATLTNGANYMFTALMNGCSLGFGSQAGDGTCLVSHANSSTSGAEGRDVQRGAQQGQLQTVFGVNPFSVIEPDSYQDTGFGSFAKQATNFGKNVGGTWQFYSHTWMPSGGTGGVMLHCGIAPAVSIPG